jgi:1,4-alpha-glucan branching enzyme
MAPQSPDLFPDLHFSENFILPLSHDEVVHGKKSLIGKMPGDYLAEICQPEAPVWLHDDSPGKKLLFMGGSSANLRSGMREGPGLGFAGL